MATSEYKIDNYIPPVESDFVVGDLWVFISTPSNSKQDGWGKLLDGPVKVMTVDYRVSSQDVKCIEFMNEIGEIVPVSFSWFAGPKYKAKAITYKSLFKIPNNKRFKKI